jgi:hypothetical protein
MSNRRKIRPPSPPGPNPQCRPVPRADAVRAIAAHVADRTAFVISVPPALLESAAYCLRSIAACDCYLDNGLDAVFRLSGEYVPLAEVMAALLPTAMTSAVFTVPKTVSAATLSQALQGQEIPADGSQDLVLLHSAENRVEFPRCWWKPWHWSTRTWRCSSPRTISGLSHDRPERRPRRGCRPPRPPASAPHCRPSRRGHGSRRAGHQPHPGGRPSGTGNLR